MITAALVVCPPDEPIVPLPVRPVLLTPADLAAFARLRIPPELLEQAHVQRVTDHEAREYGITGSVTRSHLLN